MTGQDDQPDGRGTRDLFVSGDACLRACDDGAGRPLLFQHGLGGSLDQVAETIGGIGDIRRLALECRGHGRSTAGTARPFSLALLAADVLGFLNERGVSSLVMGGISMGAALALRLAVQDPARVQALVLVRPAWLFKGVRPTLAPHRAIGAALQAAATPAAACTAFLGSAIGSRLARQQPRALSHLLAWFEREDPRLVADLLSGLAGDSAGVTRADLAALTMPAMVIGDPDDVTHPLATAAALAATLPRGRLVTVPPRSRAKAAHRQAVTQAIADFLAELPAWE